MSDRGMGYYGSPAIATMGDVAEEVVRAREKFPTNEHLLAALVEEVSELAQALLQGQPNEQIRAEAMQVACVAIRIMEEGDGAFPAAKPSAGFRVYAGPSPLRAAANVAQARERQALLVDAHPDTPLVELLDAVAAKLNRAGES